MYDSVYRSFPPSIKFTPKKPFLSFQTDMTELPQYVKREWTRKLPVKVYRCGRLHRCTSHTVSLMVSQVKEYQDFFTSLKMLNVIAPVSTAHGWKHFKRRKIMSINTSTTNFYIWEYLVAEKFDLWAWSLENKTLIKQQQVICQRLLVQTESQHTSVKLTLCFKEAKLRVCLGCLFISC